MSNWIKGTILTLLVLVSLVGANAQSLSKYEFTQIATITKSLGASASDTTYSSIVACEGDSLSFLMEANADSVSGSGRIQYISPSQFNDSTTFAYYPTVVSLVNNAKAGFGTVITARLASQQWCRVALVIKNNKASTQTVTTRIYRVRRK